MNRTDDISNLFSRFGASADSYHEFESQVDYKEKQPASRPETPVSRPEIPPKSTVEMAPARVHEEAVEVEQRVTELQHEPVSLERLDPASVVDHSAASEASSALDSLNIPQTSAPAAVVETESHPVIGDAPFNAVNPIEEHPSPIVTPSAAPNQLRNLLAEVVQARQAQAQALADESLRQAATRGRPVKCKAHIVAMVSLKGGVGKTTLAANLASSLRLEKGRTLAIDLDPQNALHYHLGVEQGVSGVGSLSSQQLTWGERLQHGFDDALLLPYGVLSADERRALTVGMREDPHWLARQLERMNLVESDVVIIDTPTGVTPSLEQALDVADEVIVVTTADAASFNTLDLMECLLGASDARAEHSSCSYVVNQFDASREFSRDMLEVLKRRLGEQLIAVVAQDNALGEALAYGRNPLSVSEPSAAFKDVVRLAEQLKARFEASPAQGVQAQ
ncbi:cellulose biosynthesis protein BcsQ [Pseudomonas sp. SIMBA_077]